MYPWLIEDPFRIGTYGLMAFIGFLVAYLLFLYELKRKKDFLKGMQPSVVADVTLVLAVVFGVIGSKLAFLLFEAPELSMEYVSWNAGLTWYGGWVLGCSAVIVWFAARKLNVPMMSDMLAPMLAQGYAFGRLGCQLAGDGCYGVPCVPGNIDAALCMTYPEGLVPSPCYYRGIEWQVCPFDAVNPLWFPVHPTPLYEALTGFMLFAFLWWLRKRVTANGAIFAAYCVGAGLLRFGIEFIRMPEMRPERFLGLRDAQLIGVGQVIFGAAILILLLFRNGTLRPGSRPRPDRDAAPT